MAQENKYETTQVIAYGSDTIQTFRTFREERATGILDPIAVYRSILNAVHEGDIPKYDQSKAIDLLESNCERIFTENNVKDNFLLSRCALERILMSPITIPRNLILSVQETFGDGLRSDLLGVIKAPFEVADFFPLDESQILDSVLNNFLLQYLINVNLQVMSDLCIL